MPLFLTFYFERIFLDQVALGLFYELIGFECALQYKMGDDLGMAYSMIVPDDECLL